MSPRRYNQDRRAAAHAATRARIVRATVELHAAQGSLATSYGMIAARAGVAPQTVHNHFPTLGALHEACIGLATAEGPQLGPEIFDGLSCTPERVAVLVQALFRQYTYSQPWMRWSHEAAVIPEIAAAITRSRRALRELLAQVIAPDLAPAPPRLLDLLGVLLDYQSWALLTAQKDRTDPALGDIVADAALALVRHHHPPTAAKPSSPKAHAGRRKAERRKAKGQEESRT
jgi:AcrR family transcriptional regulator